MKKQRPARKVVFRAVGILVGLGFLSAVIGVVIWSPDNPRARSVREWLTAVGTVGAVVVALWVTWSDRRQRERDRDDAVAKQQADAAELRKSDALSVTAFVEVIPITEQRRGRMVADQSLGVPVFRPYEVRLVCENWGSRPIHALSVTAVFNGDHGLIASSSIDPDEDVFVLNRPSLAPQGGRVDQVLHHDFFEFNAQDFKISISFLDIVEDRWRSGESGTLTVEVASRAKH